MQVRRLSWWLLGLTTTCVVSPLAFAMWGYVDADELVSDSDLILVGTLMKLRNWTDHGYDHAAGRIQVTTVLVGTLPRPGLVELKWKNLGPISCPRSSHADVEGQLALWLLTIAPDGTVRADYPRRSIALDDLMAVGHFVEELQDAAPGAAEDVRQWLEGWIKSQTTGERSN